MTAQKLQSLMKKRGIDFVLLHNRDGDNFNANFFYCSKYTGMGFLLVGRTGKPSMVVPEMEGERAKKTSKGVSVRIAKFGMYPLIREILSKKTKGKRKLTFGIDEQRISIGDLKRIKKELGKAGSIRFVDIAEDFCRLRVIKSPEELTTMKKACKMTDEIFRKTLSSFRKFKTESDVAAFMMAEAQKLGCDISFKTIVGSAKDSSQPHYEPTSKKLKKGFCVIDFGIRYNGYCSDVTRTVYLGNPSKEERDAYNAVLKAQKAAFDAAKPGIKFSTIEKSARESLGKRNKYFIHSLGHGLGLDVHENPFVSEGTRTVTTSLAEGSVFTIEPGVYYLDKFGIRIEDDVYMSKKGPVFLTKASKVLKTIKGY